MADSLLVVLVVRCREQHVGRYVLFLPRDLHASPCSMYGLWHRPSSPVACYLWVFQMPQPKELESAVVLGCP